uniref:Transmembrane protein n=1 Tax=Panagrellus redivivus TaxID=6233 RepID=A0A7E4V863_PANRE
MASWNSFGFIQETENPRYHLDWNGLSIPAQIAPKNQITVTVARQRQKKRKAIDGDKRSFVESHSAMADLKRQASDRPVGRVLCSRPTSVATKDLAASLKTMAMSEKLGGSLVNFDNGLQTDDRSMRSNGWRLLRRQLSGKKHKISHYKRENNNSLSVVIQRQDSPSTKVSNALINDRKFDTALPCVVRSFVSDESTADGFSIPKEDIWRDRRTVAIAVLSLSASMVLCFVKDPETRATSAVDMIDPTQWKKRETSDHNRREGYEEGTPTDRQLQKTSFWIGFTKGRREMDATSLIKTGMTESDATGGEDDNKKAAAQILKRDTRQALGNVCQLGGPRGDPSAGVRSEASAVLQKRLQVHVSTPFPNDKAST